MLRGEVEELGARREGVGVGGVNGWVVVDVGSGGCGGERKVVIAWRWLSWWCCGSDGCGDCFGDVEMVFVMMVPIRLCGVEVVVVVVNWRRRQYWDVAVIVVLVMVVV